MARIADLLMRPEPWSGLIMGNHALARAMIEAGTQVIATYPGSPTPEIAAALDAVPAAERPFYFEYSLNEKVALEVAAGASLNGHLSTAFFKSVGLNVASDALIQLPLMEMLGGMVVVLGDDPGANSSQNEQDNRHFSRMAYFPMFEPADPRETYAMYLAAARLSRELGFPFFLRMTTHVCHAKQVVDFGPRPAAAPDWTPRFDRANGPYIPIAATVHPLKRKALEKLEKVAHAAEASPFNTVLSPNGGAPAGVKRRGVISAAIPALAVLENLETGGQPVDLLKLGLSHPLPRHKILKFLEDHDEVFVVEELDRVMEGEIKALAWDAGARCRIHARTEIEDLQGEYDPRRTWNLLGRAWPDLFPPRRTQAPAVSVPPRLPQMCPGCGHRSAFFAIKHAIAPGTITVGDIGCHSLGAQPPDEMGEMIFCMGASPGLAAGLAMRNGTRKVVAFIGDSTLFHAGLPGLLNAILHDDDFTLVLLENGTTAMTGHQPRAGSGEIGDKIPLVAMFEALGVKLVKDVDTYKQAALAEALQEAMDHAGFAVVIARHPCMLKFVRDRRRRDPAYAVKQVAIDQELCDLSRVCVRDFGCPSFVAGEDGRVGIHPDLCIGDGSCIPTCPVGAIGRSRAGGGE
ncbi:MAG: 4Fe-4S binding protein [Candidatus Krumholzibacteriota bacterium]|nr:4Fe-4S binding protein [Candidatus Krumholzibacteriota bacterium]